MQSATRWPDQLPELWSHGAHAYDRTAERLMPQFARDALDIVELRPDDHVLDVATGTGVLALEAAGRGSDVVAIDFAEGMIDQLQRRIRDDGIERVRPVLMDGQNLEFADGTFDLAASQFGVNLFPDRSRGFQEMYRVLRPGGRIVVVTWSAMHRVEPMFAFLEAMQAAEAGPPPWDGLPPALSLQDPNDFIAELGDAGFDGATIHRVTHQMTAESADSLWEELKGFIPTITALIDALGAEQAERVGRTFIGILRERYGDGPLAMDCEGLIGVARKPRT